MTPTPTRELTRDVWCEYLDAVSKELSRAPVSIEICAPSCPPAVQAAHLTLKTITYDRRNDLLEIAAARGGPHLPSVLRHTVDHPARIEVDSDTLLAPMTIAVDGPDRVRTVITIEREPEFSG